MVEINITWLVAWTESLNILDKRWRENRALKFSTKPINTNGSLSSKCGAFHKFPIQSFARHINKEVSKEKALIHQNKSFFVITMRNWLSKSILFVHQFLSIPLFSARFCPLLSLEFLTSRHHITSCWQYRQLPKNYQFSQILGTKWCNQHHKTPIPLKVPFPIPFPILFPAPITSTPKKFVTTTAISSPLPRPSNAR